MDEPDIKGIDEDFRILIKELNKVGIKTLYCCSGHEGVGSSYIVLDITNLSIDIETRKGEDNKIPPFPHMTIRWIREGYKEKEDLIYELR